MVDARTLTYTLRLVPWFVPIGEQRELLAHLTYTTADPFAVTFAFVRPTTGEVTVEYRFARHLISDGLSDEAGDLDDGVVIGRCCSDPAKVAFTFYPEDAYPFTVLADREEISDFVEMSGFLVPPGADPADLFAEIEQVLRGGE